MVCQNCGQLFDGNFCPNCGSSVMVQNNINFRPTQTPLQKAAGKFFIAVAVVCFAAMIPLLFILLTQDNSPASSAGPLGTNAPPGIINVVSISAKDLLGEYDRNQVAADEKYSGNTLSVYGVVGSIGKDIADEVYITVGTGAKYELYSVQCYFQSKDAIKKVGKLQAGDEITVVGICDGKLLNVTLKECNIS